jgi:hypothetical protein
MALLVMGDFLERGRGGTTIDKSRALEYTFSLTASHSVMYHHHRQEQGTGVHTV